MKCSRQASSGVGIATGPGQAAHDVPAVIAISLRTLALAAALAWCASLAAPPSADKAAGARGNAAWAGIDFGKPVVLLFHSIECPISDRYIPTIKRLQETYDAGIRFYLVFPNRNETDAAIRDYLKERKVTLRFLRDPEAVLTRRAGATVTPEAVVLMPGLSGPELVYRGRYDDRYTRLGQSRPRASVHFLNDVLASVILEKRPVFVDTGAVGCYIVSEPDPSSSGGSSSSERKRAVRDDHSH